MPVILAGLGVISIISWFLAIRGIVHLFQSRAIKTAIAGTAAFIALPLLASMLIIFADNVLTDIWLCFPLIIIFLLWIALGYGIEIYLRQSQKRQMSGVSRKIRNKPKYHLLINFTSIFAGFAIWIAGLFLNLNKYPTLEVALLCLIIFLVVGAFIRLWLYRSFD